MGLELRNTRHPWRMGASLGTGLLYALALCAVGCGDDDASEDTDPDAGMIEAGSGGSAAGSGGSEAGSGGSEAGSGGSDAGSDGGDGGVAGSDADPVTVDFADVVALSADTNDRFWSVAFGDDGKIYAAGYLVQAAVDAGMGDSMMAVARFEADGSLDDSFGTDGVATLNVVEDDAGEAAHGVGLQSDGKILIAGAVNPDPASDESEIAVARLNADGSLDDSFGTDGIQMIDLGPAGEGRGNDSVWNLDVDGDDRIVLFGMAKAEDSRTDADRFIVRLTSDGPLDTDFAEDGIFSVDVEGLELDDNARNGFVQEDGKILSAGYTNIDGTNEIVLIRLDADGAADEDFSDDGVLRSAAIPAPGMAEAYGAARQTDGNYVTTGYGRTTADSALDLVSFRYNEEGELDESYGTSGGLIFDVAGDADRGRNAVALPDDRILMVGTGAPAASEGDAMVLVVTADGEPDSSFDDDGYALYDFDTHSEQFFGVAVSADGSKAAAVGYRETDAGEVDATLWIASIGD